MWRRCVGTLAGLVALVALAAWGLTCDATAAWLTRQLQRGAAQRLHQELRLGRLAVQLLPPALVLEEVTLTDADAPAAAPWLRLRAGRVRPHPWPSASGAPVLGELALEGLWVERDLDTSAAWLPPQGPTRGWALPRLPLDVRRLALGDAHLLLRDGAHEWQIEVDRVRLAPTALRGRHLVADGLRLRATSAALGPGELVATAHLEANLTGTLARPRALNVERLALALRLPDGVGGGPRPPADAPLPWRLGLQGTLATGPAGAAAAEVDWQLQGPLAALPGGLWPLPACRGALAAHGHLSGTAERPRLGLAAEVAGLQVGGRAVGDVAVEGDVDRARLVLSSWRLGGGAADGHGELTGSGRLDFAAGLPLSLAARLHQVELGRLLAAAGLPAEWLQLQLSGDVTAEGNALPPRMALELDLAVAQLALWPGPAGDPAVAPLLAVPHGSLGGRVRLQPRQAELEGLMLRTGSSAVQLTGVVPYDPAAPLAIEVAASAVELSDFAAQTRFPLDGQASVQATVQGPLARPRLHADSQFTDLSIGHHPLGSGSAELLLEMPTLQVRRLSLERGDGRIGGDGTLRLDGPALQLEAALDVARLQADDILRTLGAPEPLAAHFHGPTSGRILVAGPLALPAGVLHLASPALTVDGVELGDMQVEGAFGDPQTPFDGTLQLRPRGGALRLTAQLARNGSVQLDADVREVPMPLLTPFVGGVRCDGRLSGTLRLSGPPTALGGELDATVTDLEVLGVSLEHSHLRGTAAAGELRFDGSLLGDGVGVEGTLQLHGQMPLSATAHFANLALGRLHPLPADVGLEARGTATLAGALADPDSLQGRAQLDEAHLRYRGLVLTSAAPVQLRYGRAGLVVAPTRLLAPHLQVDGDGSWRYGGAIALHVHGGGELQALPQLVPQVVSAGGPLALELAVGGTWERPTFDGTVAVHGGSLRLGQAETHLDQVELVLRLEGRALALQRAQARVGSGRLALSGEALLPDGRPAELSLRGRLEQVALQPSPDLSATLTGDLQLSGPQGALTLGGRLHVDSLRYTAHLELDRLVPRRQAAPLRAAGGHGEPVRLALKLTGQNNIIVSSNVLEAEVQADVTLTGTTERPGLLGNVTPLWARARYRDNLFKVTRASIDFVDEYRVFTEFSVQARTEACRMTAEVSIQGNSDSYAVTPYGQDQHGVVDPQDVLACLQFGLRLHDFEGNQRTPAGLGDALPGGLDALWMVSGLDDKVKKLLPIDVDELRLTSGWSPLSQRTTARLAVGKELGSRVGLRYSRSLDEFNDQAFSLDFRLGERLSMQGSWLSQLDVPAGNFGVDMRLHWELQ